MPGLSEGASEATGPWHARGRALMLVACLGVALIVGYVDIRQTPTNLELMGAVLDHTAPAPYPYHTWGFLQVARALERLTGASPERVHLHLRLAGYAMAGVALAVWLGCVCSTPAGVLMGVFWSLATLSWVLRQHGWGRDHPADVWGVALFALALHLLARGRLVALVALCVICSATWEKHALLFLVVGLALWRPLGWWRALLWSLLVAGASVSVQVYYYLHLPVSAAIPPNATFTLENLRNHGWETLSLHAAFAGPALLGLVLSPVLRRQPLLWATLPYYPLLVGAYAARLYYLYEIRSFVVVVPILAAYLACAVEGLGARAAGEPGGVNR